MNKSNSNSKTTLSECLSQIVWIVKVAPNLHNSKRLKINNFRLFLYFVYDGIAIRSCRNINSVHFLGRVILGLSSTLFIQKINEGNWKIMLIARQITWTIIKMWWDIFCCAKILRTQKIYLSHQKFVRSKYQSEDNLFDIYFT